MLLSRFVLSALLATATLVGCGAAPTVSAAPTSKTAATAKASGAYRAHFAFGPYATLTAEEKRILEAAEIQAGHEGTLALKGQPLYEYLAQHSPKLLASYLNQTAVLATVQLENGRSALSYIQRLEALKINHVYAVVEPGMKEAIAAQSAKKSKPGVAYVGPENSSLLHGKYDTSYRENRPYTSLQFCFSAQDGFTKLDLDIDEECPLAGSSSALVKHLLRAAKHEILRKWPGEQYGENSEPDYLYRLMSLPAINPDGKPNRVGRGITPNYKLIKR